jgi:hypothetical protein
MVLARRTPPLASAAEFLELALAAAARMNLRLHDIERPGELLRRRDGFLDAHRGNALGDSDAKFCEQFFRLIFVDVHEVCRAFRVLGRGELAPPKHKLAGKATPQRPR